MLFPPLLAPPDGPAIQVAEDVLDYEDLRGLAAAVAKGIGHADRVAVWATPSMHTVSALLGALAAGVPAVPVSPKAGRRELEHIVSDSAPDLLFADAGVELPPELRGIPRVEVDLEARDGTLPAEPAEETPALIVYTSGTTGLPKGVVLSRRAIAANLDALASAWDWTAADTLVHGLPLFHVHGLV
ncbi:MAG: AMP-binding protein, partial [Solirubrobacteraceae bacterium]